MEEDDRDVDGLARYIISLIIAGLAARKGRHRAEAVEVEKSQIRFS